MDTKAKKQYMETLRERYLKANKKGKGDILDEYCRNTGAERKYAIKKFRYKVKLKEGRKKRKEYYDNRVKAALVQMWKIFDYPCGQRFEESLKEETDRMRSLGELSCSDEVALKLKKISSATIDRKLEHEREVELNKRKYKPSFNFPLKKEVPVKTAADLDRNNTGVVQIDFVEHCGSSASGEYVNSLSITDIFSGWWEGDAVMGRGQQRALAAIDESRKRFPFTWTEMHPDNGTNIMNYHIYGYALERGIGLSRSRAYKKNDNCFVEQKNSTHVRKEVGYLRYDTGLERDVISDLYRTELRLYKNFFCPVIKLVSKVKFKGKDKRKYDKARTPYRRIMESDKVDKEKKEELKAIYDSLNPAELRRNIEKKLKLLQRIYDKKKGSLSRDDRRDINSDFGVIIHDVAEAVSVS